MTDYQPKPGEEVLLTVRATLNKTDRFILREQTHWYISGTGRVVPPSDIEPGWVQIDPETLRPTGYAS